MAAIIAQLTRAARGRRTRRTYGANKCLYTLQPFDRNGFNPAIHNKSGSTRHFCWVEGNIIVQVLFGEGPVGGVRPESGTGGGDDTDHVEGAPGIGEEYLELKRNFISVEKDSTKGEI